MILKLVGVLNSQVLTSPNRTRLECGLIWSGVLARFDISVCYIYMFKFGPVIVLFQEILKHRFSLLFFICLKKNDTNGFYYLFYRFGLVL